MTPPDAHRERLSIALDEAVTQAERNAVLARFIREDMNRERDAWINKHRGEAK